MTFENVNLIKEKLRVAQDRQKSYADKRRKDLEFAVGDKVFLKLFPWKGVLRFGKRGKLSPRYIGPYEITERIGPVAYRLDLNYLGSMMFFISPCFAIHLKENLTYTEEPVRILARKVQIQRNKTVSLVKVLWQNQTVEEATWENEDQMRAQYPRLFIAYSVAS
ncbi:uncharacterized protein LOC111389885 [Olea europaea var. sylvestris]|uniref:uncharacterized protein LOC111389885 n=1 Tax=Olea europaea var. sylvestris TaxID=158386 RepID=UPI000C1D5D69|nr:uncharacterized protein LOC111389885 [Olea europaea var. sylvestris]